MAVFTNPIPAHDPLGLNRVNENFLYLQEKTNALQAPPYVVADEAAMLALEAVIGNIAIRTDITDESNQFMLTALPASALGNWMQLPMAVGAVMSVNGQTGNVNLDASAIIDPRTGRPLTQGMAENTLALLMADRLYAGQDLAVKFADEIAESGGDIWAWLRSRTQAGNFTGIHVGDYIQFTALNGNVIVSEIAGINTYRRYGSPVEVGNHIDLISRDLWPEAVPWNLVNFNNGLAAMPNPYLTSNVHAFLNALQMAVPNGTGANPATTTVDYRTTGILSQLPAELRNVIVPKVALLERRFTSGVLLTESNSWDWREIGPLWLPSEIEVYGCRQWGSNSSPEAGRSSGGFVQYPIFAENMKRVKGNGHNGARAWWWLLTAHGGFSTFAALVGSSGNASHSSASNAAGRVPVCFRIS